MLIGAGWRWCLCAALAAGLDGGGGAVQAAPVTLSGAVVDYGYEDPSAICIDVAGVNMLSYLGIGGSSVAAQQRAFHRSWDPTLAKNVGTAFDLKAGMEATLRAHEFIADISVWSAGRFSYPLLVDAWNEDQLVIALVDEVTQNLGHAVFLWGLQDDLSQKPQLAVVDPNIHPNTDHMIDGRPTNSVGEATWTDLDLSRNPNGSLEWRFALDHAAYTYTAGNVSEEFEARHYDYRIVGFVTVGNVRAMPEPGAGALVTVALFACAAFSAVPKGSRRARPAA